MDVATLEQVIECSLLHHNDLARKAEATTYLDNLRSNPESWNLGLALFFQSQNATSRYFGLSLVRDYLSGNNCRDFPQNKATIRDSVMKWSVSELNANSQSETPPYLMNNIVSILTLCLKRDYPENWPSAFKDILLLSFSSSSTEAVGQNTNIRAIDFITRVLVELDIEVVVFNDRRTREEVAHNVLIKDTMRETGVIREIVEFLCQSAIFCNSCSRQAASAENCLLCLTHYIGWIDVNLVMQHALPTIYSGMQDEYLCRASCKCLYEITKKGMDPIPKIQLVNMIGLMQVLSVAAGTLIPADDRNLISEKQIGILIEYGAVMDILFMELLGFWMKFEEVVVLRSDNNTSDNLGVELKDLSPVAASMLESCIGIVLQIFSCRATEVFPTVFQSLNKLLSLMKQQQVHQGVINMASKQSFSHFKYFLASDYLNALLMHIFSQLQYPEEFTFSEDDDEEMIIEEAKSSVKKLFVNSARLYPEICLELIVAAFSSLPTPISSAPFPAVEAALKLLHAFSECGPQNMRIISEGSFPSLVMSLHQTDIAYHRHPQVVLSYYEICVRYIKLCDHTMIQHIVSLMVGPCGLRHQESSVRCRTTYLIYRVVENMDGKSSMLLPVIGSFADLLLLNDFNSSASQLSSPRLTPESELHLLDAIGCITSSTYNRTHQQHHQQWRLLADMINILSNHIDSIIGNPAELLTKYIEQFQLDQILAHKINSLSNLATGHNYNPKEDIVDPQLSVRPLFEIAAAAVTRSLSVMAHCPVVRSKTVMFIHRIVKTLGPGCVSIMDASIGILLSQSHFKDTEDVIQLLNQGMLEFGAAAIPLIDVYFGPVVEKLNNLFIAFDDLHTASATSDSLSSSNRNNHEQKSLIEAPHVEVERAALQRHYIVFIYHVVSNATVLLLSSSKHACYLQDIFNNILSCLQGGKGKIGPALSLPLRKTAVCSLSAIIKAWSKPEYQSAIAPELKQAMYQFLYDQAIPTIFRSCADRSSINIRDAATQGLIAEIGVLLWTMHATNAGETIDYLHRLLPVLGWPDEAMKSLVTLLQTQPVAGTFKELFKQLLRTLIV